MTSNESNLEWPASRVRQAFIDFFVSKGCAFIPSSSVIPWNDPTLLFTNAGMNQFKTKFLGTTEPDHPFYTLKGAANSQKCIRAGGKHNDLDDVGRDTYHHTFFEMMGNWSFGDYFKKESIAWAWELLTQVYGLDPERLYASYYEGEAALGLEPDTESYNEWLKYLPKERIVPGNTKDNFWEMGDTGPCGMSSEIHYDMIGGGRNAAHLVNCSDEVIEIWNLVFIQFNRAEKNGKLEKLTENHVDTGMGLERVCAILQNVRANYDIDNFQKIFKGIEIQSGAAPYTGEFHAADPLFHDMSYRVIADHMRTVVFSIADGQLLDNVGRGYVVRRILRRAMRYAREYLHVKDEGFLAKLVPYVINSLKDAYPDLVEREADITSEILLEEKRFSHCLKKGSRQFESVIARMQKDNVTEFSLDEAYLLYETYGIPGDLTIRMLEDKKMVPFTFEAFEKKVDDERNVDDGRFSASKGFNLSQPVLAQLQDTLQAPPTNDEAKYDKEHLPIQANIVAIFDGSSFIDQATPASGIIPKNLTAGPSSSNAPAPVMELDTDEESLPVGVPLVGVFLDKTNFYSESGGQAADRGTIKTPEGEFIVYDTQKFGSYVVHIGRVAQGQVSVKEVATVSIDVSRRLPITSNHTMTHVLNWALRKTLGTHVEQRGSAVYPNRFRFDYKQRQAPNSEQLSTVIADVQDVIARDVPVYDDIAPRSAALKINTLRYLPEEIYPLQVRVVSVGQPVGYLLENPDLAELFNYSVEFCGGTHLKSTGQAADFVILEEDLQAAGVRRIVATTGLHAREARQLGETTLQKYIDAQALTGDALAEILPELRRIVGSKQIRIPQLVRAECRTHLSNLDKKHLASIKSSRKDGNQLASEIVSEAVRHLTESGAKFHVIVSAPLDGNRKIMGNILKEISEQQPNAALAIVSASSGPKPQTVVLTTSPANFGTFSSGTWAQAGVANHGGKGGGKPTTGNASLPGNDKLEAISESLNNYALQNIQ